MGTLIRSRLLPLSALVLLMLMPMAVLPPASRATKALPYPSEISAPGFGSSANSYAWSMAWFKGKLYVGTARDELCVEGAIIDFYKPGTGYQTNPFVGVNCPADRYDMDLRAEIWQYTPGTGSWKRVFQSPADIPNPREPGKFVARDIGFRGMVVDTQPDGSSALYVGGVTADEYIPEIAAAHPPRILRTTDGDQFTPIAGAATAIDTPFGHQTPMGYRAMTVYKHQLYVTATGGYTGDGAIVEVGDPAGPDPTFTQVSPPDMDVFDMATFSGQLYAGAGSTQTGYSVWRSNLASDPQQWIPVVTAGAGRGTAVNSVVSMQVFQHRLYVGSSGWFGGTFLIFPASELIRIDADDSWDVVVGASRTAPDGTLKQPISGLPDGFGNIFNAHFWRQGVSNGMLTVGTNDWSYVFQNVPIIDWFLRPQYGFDAYSSCDGRSWWTATTNAFGDGLENFGLRTMASYRTGYFAGSANQVNGTTIWQVPATACTGQGKGRQPPNPWGRLLAPAQPSAVPAGLTATATSCGAVLSWTASEGARSYTVLRSSSRTLPRVGLRPPAVLPNGFALGAAPKVVATATSTLSTPGPYAVIGTATSPHFLDTTRRPGEHYLYEVVAGPKTPEARISNVTADLKAPTLAQLKVAAAALADSAGRSIVVSRAAAVADSDSAAGALRAAEGLPASRPSVVGDDRLSDFEDLLARYRLAVSADVTGCRR